MHCSIISIVNSDFIFACGVSIPTLGSNLHEVSIHDLPLLRLQKTEASYVQLKHQKFLPD
jgi:hypothetical protein